MDRVSTTRFVISGVVTAFVAGLITFVALQTAYSLSLSPDTIQSLTHNGKSVDQESVKFGLLPAMVITVILLSRVADGYLARRRARSALRV